MNNTQKRASVTHKKTSHDPSGHLCGKLVMGTWFDGCCSNTWAQVKCPKCLRLRERAFCGSFKREEHAAKGDARTC